MTDKTPKEQQDERWIAYYLGDLSAAEKREVKAELEASPDKAADYEKLVKGIARWAEEPVPYTPLRMESLGLGEPSPNHPPRGRFNALNRWFRPGPWVWGLATAALLALIFTQAEFTFRLGRVDIRWGTNPEATEAAQLREEVSRLSSQLAAITTAVDSNERQIESVAYASSLQDAYLENQLTSATSQLVRYMQTETQTRYQDFQNLMQLAGIENTRTPEWVSEAALNGAPNSQTQNR